MLLIQRILLVLLLAAGAGIPAISLAEELIVSAAASLTNAFTEIGKGFEQANPGSKVVFNFAASGALLAQITQGAPVDVFASADQETMDKAQEKKLVLPETRVDFVKNTLVLIVLANSSGGITRLADLTKPEMKRIAIGNPETVPNGRYARAALKAAGLWEGLASKLIYTADVRQSLSYVARGEVDAGLVFATDAAIEKDKVRVAMKVDTAIPIVYPMAVVTASQRGPIAKEFVDYVTSDAGRAILERYGFVRP